MISVTCGADLRSPRTEKFLQEFPAPRSKHALANLDFVVQSGMIEDTQGRMYSTGLSIVGAVDQPANTRLHHGSGAHRARLNGDVQLAISKPVISDRGSSLAQSDDLGVRRRVAVHDVAIEPTASNPALANDDRAHRNFAQFERALGGSQGLLHPELVGFSR
jgi:hypothetical protein